jgi:hypothetical protein
MKQSQKWRLVKRLIAAWAAVAATTFVSVSYSHRNYGPGVSFCGEVLATLAHIVVLGTIGTIIALRMRE